MSYEIGAKIKALRLQKGLTQEELGERTDLSKGYISQLERDLASPSIETFFHILEVLGCRPSDFFDEKKSQQILYTHQDYTEYDEYDMGYKLKWLVSESNEKEIEPVIVTLLPNSSYKLFEPHLSETFIYILKGKVQLKFGDQYFIGKELETFYFEATETHQLTNIGDIACELLIVATNSYL